MAKQSSGKALLNKYFEEDTHTLLNLIESMSEKYPTDSEQWKKLNSIWVSTETVRECHD
ncbi:hypothetical protein N0M98_09870 [Paenibacillus doosanensis]|uniref:Uncharacterized protein n=1 Tax=Paenibacillus konkukensis TaxID=2020716 RepID=A0ABY4S0M1_9BACL|nr:MULTISPECIES: hypothetical protein [Paenibacillus]MCS7460448.1 hypothetical protein [Paenibacillus doosanensis]UQZ87475.1 hypothetical protein SK3146_06777 [Paenibacillus konkukensis]